MPCIQYYPALDCCAGKEEEKPLRLLKKVEQPVPRPPTPTITEPEANMEEKELALVLIQRVIRGRAIQSKVCIDIRLHNKQMPFLLQDVRREGEKTAADSGVEDYSCIAATRTSHTKARGREHQVKASETDQEPKQCMHL